MTQKLITLAVDDSVDIGLPAIMEGLTRLVPGLHGVHAVDVADAAFCDFEHDAMDHPEDTDSLPFDRDAARRHVASDGFVTVVTAVSLADMAFPVSLQEAGALDNASVADVLDLALQETVHQKAFSFGRPDGAAVSVLAMGGTEAIVEYTIHGDELFADAED